MIVFDFGLSPSRRLLLQKRFAWAEFRDFLFDAYPPHVALARKTYAWKPIALAEVAFEIGGLVLWLDSGTIFKSKAISPVLRELEHYGVYSLKGQSPISQRCAPAVLTALQVPKEHLHLNERIAGVIGFDMRKAAVRKLVAEWRDQALNEALILPRAKGHNADQSLLSLLLFKYAERGEIGLGGGEADISSARPVTWISTRNWVSGRTPRWADPMVRLKYHLYKAVDQLLWRLKIWDATRLDGFNRSLWEHFTVMVAREGKIVAIPAPGSSYCADPFVWHRDGRDWLFVEEFDYRMGRAHISCVAFDHNLNASRPVPVLQPPWHLSFPLLFEVDGALLMMPESHSSRSLDLYVCDNFPYKWRLARRLLYDVDAVDTAIIRHAGRWWLISALLDDENGGRYLGIFSAEDLYSDVWEPHPVNSERLYAGAPFSSYRNAGNILRDGDDLLRPVQLNRDYYGESTGMMRIEILSQTEFRETPYAGAHPLMEIGRACSPHHYSECGHLQAWDVRDQAGYINRAPRRDKLGFLALPAAATRSVPELSAAPT
jgi:hypothetical protein